MKLLKTVTHKMFAVLPPYESIPRGWGIAYHNVFEDSFVVAPIPLNLIIGGLRRLWHHMIMGFKPSIIDNAFENGKILGQSASINVFFDKFKDEFPMKVAQLVLEASSQGIINGLERNRKNAIELDKIELLVGEPTAEAVDSALQGWREVVDMKNQEIESLNEMISEMNQGEK